MDIDKQREEHRKKEMEKKRLKEQQKADMFQDRHKNFEKILPLPENEVLNTDKAFSPNKYSSHYFTMCNFFVIFH